MSARRDGSLSRLRGILCPACGTGTSRVIDSREQAGTVRRRRECVRCGGRWTTEERPISFSPAREGKRR